MPKMVIDLAPFTVPNYVLSVAKIRPKQDGLVETAKWELSEIAPDVLAELCAQFRKDVFKKANKVDPNG